MLESKYQAGLIIELKDRFPGCVVLKNDSDYQQGIPDLLVLFRDKWAMLEVKARASQAHEPNQDYYIELFDEMSFGAFINPSNEDEVLDALQLTFKSHRSSRVSRR